MSGLTWIQTVYKAYQQTTLAGRELNLNMLRPEYIYSVLKTA